MKKRNIGIISLLMILTFLITATSCGEANDDSSMETEPFSRAEISFTSEIDPSADDASTILGSWGAVWDMSGLFNSMIAMGDKSMGEFVHIEKLDFPMQFSFDEDGTYTVSLDEDAIKASLAEIEEDLLNGLNNYFAYRIEENELNMTVEDLLIASGYESMDEYLDMVMGGFEGASESLVTTGNWKIEDGKLYMDNENAEIDENEYFTYELTDNELTLLEVFGTDMEDHDMETLFGALLDGLFPMVLTRAE